MKTFAKTLLLSALLLPLAGRARAQGACAECKDMAALEAQFLKLNFKVQKDYRAGYNLTTRLYALAGKFRVSGRTAANRLEQYAALVKLVAAGLPYDMESGSAEVLAATNEESADFKRVYQQALGAVAEKCRYVLLSSSVQEQTCTLSERKSGNYEKGPQPSPDPCVARVPDYPTCIGATTAP